MGEPKEVDYKVKEAAEISIGTEISEEDIISIKYLCQQVWIRSLLLQFVSILLNTNKNIHVPKMQHNT